MAAIRTINMYWLVFTYIAVTGSNVYGLAIPEANLLAALYEKYGDPQTRPVIDQNKTVRVGISVTPASLVQFQELDQLVTIQSYFHLSWIDEVLRWDPTENNGIVDVGLDTGDIWLPDLTIPETIGETFDDLHNERALIQFHGRIDWYFIGVTTTFCQVLVKFFPYDVQHCDVSFTSWNYNVQSLDFYHINESNNKVHSANGAWALTEVSLKKTKVYYCDDQNCPPFSKLTFTIELERTMQTFFALNIIMPCLLLSILNLLVFIIPIESGDKMGFIMTNALSLVLFQQLVASMLPPSGGDTPIISMHLFYMILAGCTAIIWEIMVLNFYFQNGSYPRWLYKIFSARICHRHVSFANARPSADGKNNYDEECRRETSARPLMGYEGNANNNADTGESSGTLHRMGSSDTLRRKVYPHILICNKCGHANTTTITSTVAANQVDPEVVSLKDMDHTAMWQETAFFLDRLMAYLMTVYTVIVYIVLLYGYGSYDPKAYRASLE